MKSTSCTGTWGEAQIAKWMRAKKYRLLASQWRCRFGEIDLIARDPKGMLCFVEVKLRSNLSHGLPREFVHIHKQEKIKKAAMLYMSLFELDEPVRFDVAEVYTNTDHTTCRISYLENAF